MRRFAILLLAGLLLGSCAEKHQPPVGRWIGHYESPTVMVVAWLEITPAGEVRVSAPDFLDIGDRTDDQLREMHKRLAYDLSEGWGEVKLRQYDFDGRVFRKLGGVAPQMEWDPVTKDMKVVFYFGMSHSIRIPMQPVKNFNEDPWLP
jgi:hypothetical protein